VEVRKIVDQASPGKIKTLFKKTTKEKKGRSHGFK
jgi:hypothetical protein